MHQRSVFTEMNVWIKYLYWTGEYPCTTDHAASSRTQTLRRSKSPQLLIKKHQMISNHSEKYREKKDTINVVEDCSHYVLGELKTALTCLKQ